MVLIPKRERLRAAGRIHRGESGTPLNIQLYTMEKSALGTWVSYSYAEGHSYRASALGQWCNQGELRLSQLVFNISNMYIVRQLNSLSPL